MPTNTTPEHPGLAGVQAAAHADQRVPYEYQTYAADGEVLLARDVPEGTVELYRVARPATNVRAFPAADAVLYNGKVVTAHYQENRGTVLLQHDYAGRVDALAPTTWLDDPAFILDQLESTAAPTLLSGGHDA